MPRLPQVRVITAATQMQIMSSCITLNGMFVLQRSVKQATGCKQVTIKAWIRACRSGERKVRLSIKDTWIQLKVVCACGTCEKVTQHSSPAALCEVLSLLTDSVTSPSNFWVNTVASVPSYNNYSDLLNPSRIQVPSPYQCSALFHINNNMLQSSFTCLL